MAKAKKAKFVPKVTVVPAPSEAVARLEAAAAKAAKKGVDQAVAAKEMEAMTLTNTPAPVVEKKLTKRSTTQLTQVLVATDKKNKNRAEHVKAAWEAVVAKLPTTAAELCKLEPLQVKECVSPQAFVSYMLRRGYLAVKEQA